MKITAKKLSNYRTLEVLLGLLVFVCFNLYAESPPAPSELSLRVEGTSGSGIPENYAGIENPYPQFSWDSANQEAFQIQLGIGNPANPYNVIWDTEKVISSNSYCYYDGSEPLQSRERYHWRVRIWDNNDPEASPSDWALDSPSFEMNTFIFNRDFEPIGNQSPAFAFGDVTGNGLRDIVISAHTGTTGELIVYGNTGSGEYEAVWSTDSVVSESIALADLNSNGSLDLIVLNRQSAMDSLYIFKNKGDGTFEKIFQRTGDGSRAVAVGDINRNGRIDIVEAFYGVNRVWLNRKENFDFTEYTFGGNKNNNDIALADLNGNGYLDLIVANSGANEVYLNTGQLNSPFENTADWNDESLTPVTSNSLVVIDINGNGLWDFVIGGRIGDDPAFYRLYMNEGDGTFNGDGTTEPYDADSRALTSGDINNNGLLDLADGNLDRDLILINEGGSFDLLNEGFYSNEQTYRAVLADFTGNGKADLLRGFTDSKSKLLIQVPDDLYVPYEPPAPPTDNFAGYYSTSTGKLHLSWGHGESGFTPQSQLSYNIRIGTYPGGGSIISGALGSTDNSGSFWGNIGRSTYVNLQVDPQTFFWSVQAIDGVKNAGQWSVEHIINTPPSIGWAEEGVLLSTCARQWSFDKITDKEYLTFIYHEDRRGLIDIDFRVSDIEGNRVRLTGFSYSTAGADGTWYDVADDSPNLTLSGNQETSNWPDKNGEWFKATGDLETEHMFTFTAADMLRDEGIITGNNYNFKTSSFTVRFTVVDEHDAESEPVVSEYFSVDLKSPSVPGSLITTGTYDKDSITLEFSTPSADDNFKKYMIFYGETPGEAGHYYPGYGTIHADEALLSYDFAGATSTVFEGLNPDTTYYFRIWAYDKFGNYSRQPEEEITVRKTNHPPDIEIYSVYQATDGSGLVYISFTGFDNDVEYSSYSWSQCTFSLGGSTYEMKPSTGNILFSGEPLLFTKDVSTSVFVWDAGQQLAELTALSDNIQVNITLTVFDGRDTGSAGYSNFNVDNKPPYFEAGDLEIGEVTSGTIEWLWPRAVEENFVRYELWYSSVSAESVINRSTQTAHFETFVDINKTDDITEELLSQTRYWGQVWAYDGLGYETYTSTVSRTTGYPPSLWVSAQPDPKRDGSGHVEFEVKINDPDGYDNWISVKFSTDGVLFHNAHIGQITDKDGIQRTPYNIEEYQISGIPTKEGEDLITNTLVIRWDSKDQLPGHTYGLDGQNHENVYLRITPFDGYSTGESTQTQAVRIDNSRPELIVFDDPDPLIKSYSWYSHDDSELTLYFHGEYGEQGEFLYVSTASVDFSKIMVSTGTGQPGQYIDLEGSDVEFSLCGDYVHITITDTHRNWIARRDGEGKRENVFLRLLSGAVVDSYGNPNIEEEQVNFHWIDKSDPVYRSNYLTWYPAWYSYPFDTLPQLTTATYEIIGGDIKLKLEFDEYMDVRSFRDTDLSSIVIYATSPFDSRDLSHDENITVLTEESDSKIIEFDIPTGFHLLIWDFQDGNLFLSIPEESDLRDLSGNHLLEISTDGSRRIETPSEEDAPTVSTQTVSPKPGEYNVSKTTSIYVGFSTFLVDDPPERKSPRESINIRQIEGPTGEKLSNEISPEIIVYCREDKLLEFVPSKPFPGNSLIEVTIDGNEISNFFGEHMEEDFIWRFRTQLDRGKDNLIRSPSGIVEILVPAGQFVSDGVINFTEGIPSKDPHDKVSIDAYNEAVRKERSWGNPYKYPIEELSFEVLFSTDRNNHFDRVAFTENAQITINYSTVIISGLTKTGTWDYIRSDSKDYRHSPPVAEKTLRIYYLDEDSRMWRPLASEVDTDEKTITAPMRHFSIYTVMGGKNYSAEDAYAYPVPYKPSEIPEDFKGDPARSGIRFTRLPSECEIEIYTISGRLVNSFTHSDDNLLPGAQAGSSYWYPVENRNGRPLESGVYIYVVESSGNRKSGKLMIIR